MLNKNKLISRAIENFPTWMNIRKRWKTSNGGNLIQSTAEEIEIIQEKINNFIDDCFISNYKDKTEKVVDFAYRSSIGNNKLTDIVIVNPELDITDSLDYFYINSGVALYQEGYIITKKRYENLKCKIKDYEVILNQERIHVWNIYDEFAIFLGMKRYEDETNKELYKRIIKTASKPINCSEEGLKHSIVAALTNIIDELEDDDIKIERPTANNLIEMYDNSEEIIDHLMKVNKDVIDYKKWDLNKWFNDFKVSRYLANEWNEELDEEVNGIGCNEDLKIISLDSSTKTDLKLNFYKKEELAIDSYIRKNNIENKLNLSLSKYSDFLNSYEAKYKITAEDVIDINEIEQNAKIMLVASKKVEGEQIRRMADIATSANGIRIKNNGLIDKEKFYRVKFYTNDKYSNIEVKTCEVVNANASDEILLNLKNPNGDYILDSNIIKNKYVKKVAVDINNYDYTENITGVGNGISILNTNKEAIAKLNIDNCSANRLKVIYDCAYNKVLDSDIKMDGFYKNEENNYISEGQISNLEVNINANQFRIALNGQSNITAIINGDIKYNGTPKIIDDDGNLCYETERHDNPQDMRIIISNVNGSQVIVNNMQYNNYEFNVSTDEGKLIRDDSEDNLYWIPQSYENTLNIYMKANSQFTPILRKVFVGRGIDSSDAYITELINGYDMAKLKIEANCEIELYESEKAFVDCIKNDDMKITASYSTDDSYVAIKNGAYIVLDTLSYENIKSVKTDVGQYEIIGSGDYKKHIIRLNNGDSISKVVISGTYNKIVSIKTLHELIKNECISYSEMALNNDGIWISGDRLYSSCMMQGFIVERVNKEQLLVKIGIDSFNIDNKEEVNKVEVININNLMNGAFVNSRNEISYSNTYNLKFESFYLCDKSVQKHIAINQNFLYSDQANNLPIINTFDNNYDEYKLMLYKIDCNDKNLYIEFCNNKNWSIGTQPINIKMLRNSNYNKINRDINDIVAIKSAVNLKSAYIAENKEVIELDKYIINKNNDYEVIYRNDLEGCNKVEALTIKADKFNKLIYSNVYAVKYILSINNDEKSKIDEKEYSIDKEKGIVIWNNADANNIGKKIFIYYTINKAIAVKYNIDWLYNNIKFAEDAYKHLGDITINNLIDRSIVNLEQPNNKDEEKNSRLMQLYKESDFIFSKCTDSSFSASKKDAIITINKIGNREQLAVKTGWYYIGGKEYYMFASDYTNSVTNNNKYIITENVNIEEDIFKCHKKTTNKVKNSKLNLSSIANIYHVDNFTKVQSIKNNGEILKINTIDKYNNWNKLGMDIKIVNINNSCAYEFDKKYDYGYAFIEITDLIKNDSIITFISDSEIEAYIGEGLNIYNDTREHLIISLAAFNSNTEDIKSALVQKNENRLYILIKSSGIIKDLIISDKNASPLNIHQKAIDQLNLIVQENISTNSKVVMPLKSKKGNKNNGAEIDSAGYIKNASNVEWNNTKIREIRTKKEWLELADLENLDLNIIDDLSCVAIAKSGRTGIITTKPIYIDDLNSIKSFSYKINDISEMNGSGIKVEMLQSQSIDGNYIKCPLKYNEAANYNITQSLEYKYIKLVIYLESNKVINSIDFYIQYKSTKTDYPYELISQNSKYLSEVLDTRYNLNYRLLNVSTEEKTKDVNLFIRGSKEDSGLLVWSEWKEIKEFDNVVSNEISFNGYRYFQLRVDLNGRDAKIKINNIVMEVVE